MKQFFVLQVEKEEFLQSQSIMTPFYYKRVASNLLSFV